MPHPDAYADPSKVLVGDVVYIEGASAILGDVQKVETDENDVTEVTVTWRSTTTVELVEDLILNPAARPLADIVEDNPPTMVGITESSEVLGFLENAFQYRNLTNVRNAERGRQIIESHPDYGKMVDDAGTKDELLTAASDTIADILHALNAAGVFDNEHGGAALCGRALRAYEGDFEDEIGV